MRRFVDQFCACANKDGYFPNHVAYAVSVSGRSFSTVYCVYSVFLAFFLLGSKMWCSWFILLLAPLWMSQVSGESERFNLATPLLLRHANLPLVRCMHAAVVHRINLLLVI